MSTETIYQSLYVQSRGALKRDLTRYLRTGRAVRRPSRKVGQRKEPDPETGSTSMSGGLGEDGPCTEGAALIAAPPVPPAR